MKKHIYIFLLGVFTLLISCSEEETQMFDTSKSYISFSGKSQTYSFLSSGVLKDTVAIELAITGQATKYVRKASAFVVKDSTTANATEYNIIDCIIDTNSFNGKMFVELNRPDGETFDDRRVYFEVKNSDDFNIGIDSYKNFELKITNKLTPPKRWTPTGWISKYYLGNYSTEYYKFIIKVTGETQICYPWYTPGYNNNEEWSSSYAQALKAKLAYELKKYNESIAPDYLKHDDGLAKGEKIVVGKYYKK